MMGFAANVWQRATKITVVEWLVILLIVGILAALLLLVPAQWVSDGVITLPVRVLVFDPLSEQPIVNAQVAIMKAPPVSSLDDVHQLHDRLPPVLKSTTGQTGSVVIKFTFETNASNQRPVKRAHVGNAWVVVEAAGYGGVVVPVRYASQSTAELRKQGELLVTIGLLRVK